MRSILILVLISFKLSAQNLYVLDSQFSFGGNENDVAYGMVEAENGSFIVVGSTQSNNSFDVPASQAHKGNSGLDIWVIKVNSEGKILWNKTFGGTNDDIGTDIVKSPNGDYFILGSTTSDDGDALYNGVNGGLLLIRLRTDGTLVSKRVIPGGRRFTQSTYHLANEFAQPSLKVDSKGFLYIGATHEIGGNPYTAKDFYLSKLSPTGDTIWERIYGSSLDDQMDDFAITANGEILMVGSTLSFANEINGAGNGGLDMLAIKADANGNLLWKQAWGGNTVDLLHGVVNAASGYILVGETTSRNGISSNPLGQKDAFAMKINESGNVLWSKNLGGEVNDNFFNVIQAGNGNYMAFGVSDSPIKGVPAKGPFADAYGVMLDEQGQILTQFKFGGEDIDVARCGLLKKNGDWALAGLSRSESEDVSLNRGENDFWVMNVTPPRPLEFSQFKAEIGSERQGKIFYKTSYQKDADKIVIERSQDGGVKYVKLTEINVSTNTSTGSSFTYEDFGLKLGQNHYRVKFYDQKGKEFKGPYAVLNLLPLALENQEKELKIYPNPVAERLQLNCLNAQAEIKITDMSGRSCPFYAYFKPQSGWLFELKDLAEGVYLMSVKDEEKRSHHRFIIHR